MSRCIKFSFVVPVHGTEALLPRCLESILKQTAGDFEVVVVDDCSPGGCRAIVDGFHDPRLRYVRHDRNRGLLQARVSGLNAAAGDFVIPVDSDDYVLPELVAGLEAALDREPGLDLIVFRSESDTAGVISPVWHNHAPGRMHCRQMLEEVFAGRMFWPMWGKAIRTSLYRRAVEALELPGGFYLNSTEDLCQMLPILLLGGRGVFVDCAGYRYYDNADSMTKALNSVDKIVSIAEQNVLSVETVRRFVAKLCPDAWMDGQVVALKDNTLLWLLEEIDRMDAARWKTCLEALCRIYGTASVLRLALRKDRQMLKRIVRAGVPPPVAAGRPVTTIAVVCVRNHGGGAERATLLWARQMTRLGKRIVWLYDDSFAEAYKTYASPEDAWPSVVLPTRDEPLRVEALVRALAEYDVDTCLLPDHWKESFFVDLLTVKACGVRAIVAEHNMYFFPVDDNHYDMLATRQLLYPLADAVTALSPQNVSWWHAVGLSNVVYMPNYLTFSASDSMKRTMPVGCELLFCGRVCERKGALDVLAVLASLRSRLGVTDAHVSFVGRFDSDAFGERMRRQARKLGVERSVTFVGEVTDVRPYFERARFLVLASRVEGLPMVINEARSYSLPSVIYDLPYADCLDEAHGVVPVPQDDPVAMAGAIAAMLKDDRRYAALCQAAKGALELYTDERVTARWTRLLEQLEHSERIDPQCADAEPSSMLAMTMSSLSALRPTPVSQVWSLSTRVTDLSRRLEESQSDVERLRSSRAYRLGRVLTWPFRKIHRILQQ